MPFRRAGRKPRPLQGGWRKLFYFSDELDTNGYPYGPMLEHDRSDHALPKSVLAVPPELWELIRQWGMVPMRYDATLSGVVADWIADHRDVILAHPFNRAKRNRDTARKMADRIEENMRVCFHDGDRNHTAEPGSAP